MLVMANFLSITKWWRRGTARTVVHAPGQLEAAIILRKGTELRAAALAISIVDPLRMEQPQSKPFYPLNPETKSPCSGLTRVGNTRRGALRRAGFTRTGHM
jgi:hypothetical protein